MIYNDIIDKTLDIYSIFAFLTVFIFLIFMSSLLFPSKLHIDCGEVRYSCLKFIKITHRNSLPGFSVGVGGRKALFYNVKYTITDIESYNLCQTKIEKALNIGHIEICGKTQYYSKAYSDSIDVKEKHVIFGISGFKKFKEKNESEIINMINYKSKFD